MEDEPIPISSSFFGCLVSLLYTLRISLKVKLISSQICGKWRFSFPNQSQISWLDLLSLVIADDMIAESKYCFRLYRVHEFADCVEKMASIFKVNPDYVSCVARVVIYYQKYVSSLFDTVIQKEIKNLIDRIGTALGISSFASVGTNLLSFTISTLIPIQFPLRQIHSFSVTKENIEEKSFIENQWVRDKEVSHCSSCGVPFSIMLRKVIFKYRIF